MSALTGFVGSFTKEQEAAVEAFKAKLDKDDKADEYTISRFLRARKWSVDDALDLYAKDKTWRASLKLDDPDFLKATPAKYELFRKHWPAAIHKFSKNGEPVSIIKEGAVAVELMQKNFTEQEIQNYLIYRTELLMKAIRDAQEKFKKPIDRFITIWDFKGMSWSHRHRVSTLKFTSQLARDHYPERVEKLVFINAPWMFPALFKLVKPFIDTRTLHKIDIVPNPYTKKLLELIDEDSLPSEYGGKCQCSGGCVPVVEREMLEKELELEKKDQEKDHMELKQQTVAARYSAVVSVHSGGYLEEEKKNKDFGFFGWCVNVAAHDIKISITFTPDDKKNAPVSVLAETRCSTHEGAFTALEPGRLDVVFDNTYSRLRSKTINYAITFATQHDHEDKEKESVETVAAKAEQAASED